MCRRTALLNSHCHPAHDRPKAVIATRSLPMITVRCPDVVPIAIALPTTLRPKPGGMRVAFLTMADGFAQSTGKPALVNVHTGAGTGNAMGSLVAAYRGNTPLIVTAGQQAREMVLCEPYLTNTQETLLPQPWVKWAYQPARAEDVPAAFMPAQRAVHRTRWKTDQDQHVCEVRKCIWCLWSRHHRHLVRTRYGAFASPTPGDC